MKKNGLIHLLTSLQNLLERKKTKNSSLKLGQSRSGPGLVVTQKQGRSTRIVLKIF